MIDISANRKLIEKARRLADEYRDATLESAEQAGIMVADIADELARAFEQTIDALIIERRNAGRR